MKRLMSFIGTTFGVILVLAVVAFGFSNPAASVPQDNTSSSVTKDMSPPNSMGTLTANNTAMHSGTAPPVFAYNTEMAATTTLAENISLTTAITISPPTMQYSDINAGSTTISGFERAGPMTSTLSNGQSQSTDLRIDVSPMITSVVRRSQSDQGAAIPAQIVRSDYPNPFTQNTMTNGAARSSPANTVLTSQPQTKAMASELRC